MAREDFIDDGYDPNEIYSGGSKDQQGHSSNVRAHIPDPWMAIMAEFVASIDWPEYRTVQDFVRDAIYHRMRWAQRGRGRLVSTRIQTLMAQAQIEAALSHRMRMQESHRYVMDLMQQAFSRALANNDYIGVRETIKEVEALLDRMEEPWRTEAARVLQSWENRL